MYPNYRTTAAQRRDKVTFGCFVTAMVLLVVGIIGAYLGLAYIGAHFIAKYW